MSTISVPIPPKLETFINEMVKSGAASNKADLVRRAIAHYAEDQAVQAVLRSEQEAASGKVLHGDPKELMNKLS